MGSYPTQNDKERFLSSDQYSLEHGRFTNRQQEAVDNMWERSSTFKYLVNFIFGTVVDGSPANKLPEVQPALDLFLQSSEVLKVIWFGHSTLLVNIDGHIVLIDPVFSNAAFPIKWLA